MTTDYLIAVQIDSRFTNDGIERVAYDPHRDAFQVRGFGNDERWFTAQELEEVKQDYPGARRQSEFLLEWRRCHHNAKYGLPSHYGEPKEKPRPTNAALLLL